MKKIFAFGLLLCLFALLLSGCMDAGEKAPAPTASAPDMDTTGLPTEDAVAERCDVALICDSGVINDKSFNQNIWDGLSSFAAENSLTARDFTPTEATEAAFLAAIDTAVAAGAGLVVCPGDLFPKAVATAAETYPEVSFLAMDGGPEILPSNLRVITFAEQEAGFLAGYAAVMEGYTRLGFMGGVAVPSVVRYGAGFVQGVNAAALELGQDVRLQYCYCGLFTADSSIQTLAGSWYINDIDVIFSCGGDIIESIAAAAEPADAAVIGSDVDHYKLSDTIITSASKALSSSVYDAAEAYFEGSFRGGSTEMLTAASGGVGLEMTHGRFQHFTQEDYDELLERIESGSLPIQEITDEAYDLSQLVGNRVTFVAY